MQQSNGRGSRAAALLALRATTSGAESVWGASEAQARHACVSQEHAVLAKDLATSLLEVHKKSHCSQVCISPLVAFRPHTILRSSHDHENSEEDVSVGFQRLCTSGGERLWND